jgi:hypothetical protein
MHESAIRTVLLALTVSSLAGACENGATPQEDGGRDHEPDSIADDAGVPDHDSDVALDGDGEAEDSGADLDPPIDGGPHSGADAAPASDAEATVPNEVCGHVRILQADDHSGTSVLFGEKAVQTDREGKYCLPFTTSSGPLTILSDGREPLSIGARLTSTAAGGSIDYCKVTSVPDPLRPKLSIETCVYENMDTIELPRATRVVSGAVEEIIPGGRDTFLYTHDLRYPPYSLARQVPPEPETMHLSRGFFDGRLRESLEIDFVASFFGHTRPHFWAPTVNGNMFFYRAQGSVYKAVVASSGSPVAVSGFHWLGLAPDGKTALLFDRSGSTEGISALELQRAPGQQTFTQHPVTPSAAYWPYEMFRDDVQQRFVQIGADGWIYFWDAVGDSFAISQPRALRRVKVEGGPSELVAENTVFMSLVFSPDKRWIAWGSRPTSTAPANIVVGRADGSGARVVSQYEPSLPPGLPASFNEYSNVFSGVRLGVAPDVHFDGAAQVWPAATGFAYNAGPDGSGAPAGIYGLRTVDATRHYLGASQVRGVWGSWIGLAAGNDPSSRSVTLMQIDGSDRHTLEGIADSDRIEFRERRVLVTTMPADGATRGRLRLFNLDDASGLFEAEFVLGPAQLMNPPQISTLAPVPAFLPDGSGLTFWSEASGDYGTLRIVGLDGQPRASIPRAADPQFSPDGRHLIFQTEYQGSSALASRDRAGALHIHARGRVAAWLSGTRLLATHGRYPFQQGLYAVELPD